MTDEDAALWREETGTPEFTEPKRRGPPIGHPPYRPVTMTEQIHLKLDASLKARIEADAATKGLTVNKWLRLAAEAVLNA